MFVWVWKYSVETTLLSLLFWTVRKDKWSLSRCLVSIKDVKEWLFTLLDDSRVSTGNMYIMYSQKILFSVGGIGKIVHLKQGCNITRNDIWKHDQTWHTAWLKTVSATWMKFIVMISHQWNLTILTFYTIFHSGSTSESPVNSFYNINKCLSLALRF